jgi:hypothetical protein
MDKLCPFTPVIDEGGTKSRFCVKEKCQLWKSDGRSKDKSKGDCGLKK